MQIWAPIFTRMFRFPFVSSLRHAMHHFGLDGAVTEVLSIKVLRFVAHAVSGVADDGDLDFRVVWHLVVLAVLIRSHGDLEACGHGLEVFCSAHVTVLQARSHWVHVEERVLSVLDVCARRAVQRLVSLVADSRQI